MPNRKRTGGAAALKWPSRIPKADQRLRDMAQPGEGRALPEALDELYRVFSSYPLRAWTAPCPCGHDAAAEQRLHAQPLWTLTNEALGPFVFDCANLWGTLEDLKHFLPRILELAAFGRLEVDLAHLARKLVAAAWEAWPPHEVAAVRGFWVQLHLATLTHPAVPIAELLDAIEICEADIAPYLARWQALLPTVRARELLARLISETAHLMLRPRNRNSQLVRWLRSDDLLQAVCKLGNDGEALVEQLAGLA